MEGSRGSTGGKGSIVDGSRGSTGGNGSIVGGSRGSTGGKGSIVGGSRGHLIACKAYQRYGVVEELASDPLPD